MVVELDWCHLARWEDSISWTARTLAWESNSLVGSDRAVRGLGGRVGGTRFLH